MKQPVKEIEEKDDMLIMSVRLASGRFESSIQVPLFATEDEKREFVDQWCGLMLAGLKCGQSHRRVKEQKE
jgi:hypothetical protein